MPITIPQFLQARDIIDMNVSAGTPNASGVVTFGTAVDLSVAGGAATFKALEISLDPAHLKVHASGLVVPNYVVEEDDFTVTIREVIPANGEGNLLALAYAHDYIRVGVLYRPHWAATGGTQLVVAGVRGTLQTGIQMGENVASLTLRPAAQAFWAGNSAATPPF